MTITLSPETQKLLEERMKMNGLSNPDDAVRAALMVMEETEGQMEDDRSPETQAAIRQGMADADAGRSRPWEEFKKEWMAKHQQD